MGGNLKKIVTFGTKCFVRYSCMSATWDVRHWELSLYFQKTICKVCDVVIYVHS